jgi:hypothetical protein
VAVALKWRVSDHNYEIYPLKFEKRRLQRPLSGTIRPSASNPSIRVALDLLLHCCSPNEKRCICACSSINDFLTIVGEQATEVRPCQSEAI